MPLNLWSIMKITVTGFWRTDKGTVVSFAHPLLNRYHFTPEGHRALRILYKIFGSYFQYTIDNAFIYIDSALSLEYDSLVKLQAAFDQHANVKLNLQVYNVKASLAGVGSLESEAQSTSSLTLILHGNLPLTLVDREILQRLIRHITTEGPFEPEPFCGGLKITLHNLQGDPWQRLEDFMAVIQERIM